MWLRTDGERKGWGAINLTPTPLMFLLHRSPTRNSLPMDVNCTKCGRNLALVGRVHNCTPIQLTPDTVVNTTVNKRGAYPNTEARREYMRAYMRKRRSK